MAAQYAIPKYVKTTYENDSVVIQLATMYTIEDVQVYSAECRSYGAKIVDTFRNMVVVKYEKDSDGKIGPKYN
jgi:hypothetical protein